MIKAKHIYRAELRYCLQQNNIREMFWGGFPEDYGHISASAAMTGTWEKANDMNRFFNRFNGRGAWGPEPEPERVSPID